MKTVITALTALFITAGAFANGTKAENKTSNASVNATSVTSMGAAAIQQLLDENMSLKLQVANLAESNENLQMELAYTQTMQQTLNMLDAAAEADMAENMQAERSYQELMISTISNLNDQAQKELASESQAQIDYIRTMTSTAHNLAQMLAKA